MENNLYTVHWDTFKHRWLLFKGQELVATYLEKWGDVANNVADILNAKENGDER